jgi:hypothetical protein
MATEFRPPDRSKHVRPERVKRRTSRQKRQRQTRDEEYLALRDMYLAENPNCWCGYPATEVHHIVRGTAGRSRSLLNTNTFLGVCRDCHGRMEQLPWVDQVAIKQATIIQTVERLRN